MSKPTNPAYSHVLLGAAIAVASCAQRQSAEQETTAEAAGALVENAGLPDDAVGTVPMPSNVDSVGFARYMPDGGIVTSFTEAGSSRLHVGYLGEGDGGGDGGGFRCLTCGIDDPRDLGRPKPFQDGWRVLLQSPSNDNTAGEITFVVLECTPSIADCAEARLVDIEGTADPDAIQTRIAMVSPDGQKLAWNRIGADGFSMLMGDLVRDDSGYRVDNVLVVTPPNGGPGSAGRTAAAGAWYEAKSFSPDGRGLVFSGTLDQSLNLDSYVLDLESGTTRRLTTDPDWDEWASMSPDGRWFVQASSRGENRTAVFGALPRPPFLDFAVVGPLFNVFLPRSLPGQPHIASEAHRPYLFDARGEGEGFTGSLLYAPEDDGWSSRHPTMSPDSAHVLWSARYERDEARPTRLRIATPGHAPTTAPPFVQTPTPLWAPPADSAPERRRAERQVFRAPGGGQATLTIIGDLRHGRFEVEYENYAVEGCATLSGTQTVTTTTTITALYEESLVIEGCRSGYSELSYSFAGKLTQGGGEVEIDGRRYEQEMHPE